MSLLYADLMKLKTVGVIYEYPLYVFTLVKKSLLTLP
jgi:hypothetical protein